MNSQTEEIQPAAAQKKSSPVRVVILLSVLAVVVVFVFAKVAGGGIGSNGKPSESMARKIVEEKIAKEGRGSVKLVSFRKTDAKEGDVFGAHLYELRYEAEIEFSERGSWLKGNGDLDKLRFVFSPETYGGNVSSRIRASLDSAVSVAPGQREKAQGSLTFQKTETGWQKREGDFN